MQIIIVGCGNVGVTLTEHLSSEGHDITVIDQNAKKVQSVSNRYDVKGIIGNGASYMTLIEAGIETADLMIAATGLDEQNLLSCLFARKAGGCQTIARVRNPEYIKEISFIKEELGLSMTINPEYAAATEIARLLRFPSAIEIDTFSKGKIELLKFKLEAGNCLCKTQLKSIHAMVQCDVLVCAVERGGDVVIPDGNFMLEDGDVISIVASPANSAKFFKRIGVETNQVKDAILVGGGAVSYYLAQQLCDMGIEVTLLEKNFARCEQLSELLPKARVINGDEIDRELLLEMGVRDTEAFAALTGMDEENVMLSLFAKRFSKAKLITKVDKISFDEIVDNMDLGSVIYPKYITSEYIIQYVRAMQNSIGSNVETMYKLIGDRVEALEFHIREDAPVVNIPLQDLDLKPNLLICSINHQGHIITPRGQDKMQVGDTVVVVTTNLGLKDVKDILK
ncbi:MAG: Trk system potassium transporter TrkA [Lachnospiraceae bacterium]|nr:Trk system potassium transporter TrkA [Lachnospiraceae bacterium]